MKVLLKTKMIIASLAVIVICGLAATVVGIHLIGDTIISQAQDKVRIDLNSARHMYRDEIEELKASVHLTAQRFFLKDALSENDIEKLKRELGEIRKRESLDILTLTDETGRVIVRAQNPSINDESQEHDELVSRALSSREVIGATVIMAREELLKEGPDLAEQAYIKTATVQRIEYFPHRLSSFLCRVLLQRAYQTRVLEPAFDIMHKSTWFDSCGNYVFLGFRAHFWRKNCGCSKKPAKFHEISGLVGILLQSNIAHHPDCQKHLFIPPKLAESIAASKCMFSDWSTLE